MSAKKSPPLTALAVNGGAGYRFKVLLQDAAPERSLLLINIPAGISA